MGNALFLSPEHADKNLEQLLMQEIADAQYTLVDWHRLPADATPWMPRLIKWIEHEDCRRIIIIMHDRDGRVNPNVVWELGFSVGFQSAKRRFEPSHSRKPATTLAIAVDTVFGSSTYPADLKQLGHVLAPADLMTPSNSLNTFLTKLRTELRSTVTEEILTLRTVFSRHLRDRCGLTKDAVSTYEHDISHLLPHEDAPATGPDQFGFLGELRSLCNAYVETIARSSGVAREQLLPSASGLFHQLCEHITAHGGVTSVPLRLGLLSGNIAKLANAFANISKSPNTNWRDSLAAEVQQVFAWLLAGSPYVNFPDLTEGTSACLTEVAALCEALTPWYNAQGAACAFDTVLELFRFFRQGFSHPGAIDAHHELLSQFTAAAAWHAHCLAASRPLLTGQCAVIHILLRASSSSPAVGGRDEPSCYIDALRSLQLAVERAQAACAESTWGQLVCRDITDHAILPFASFPTPVDFERRATAVDAALKCCEVAAELETALRMGDLGLASATRSIAHYVMDLHAHSTSPRATTDIANAFVSVCNAIRKPLALVDAQHAAYFREVLQKLFLDSCVPSIDPKENADTLHRLGHTITAAITNLYSCEWMVVDPTHKSLTAAVRTLACQPHGSQGGAYDLRLDCGRDILMACKDGASELAAMKELPEPGVAECQGAIYRVQVAGIDALANGVAKPKTVATRVKELVGEVTELASLYATYIETTKQSDCQGDGGPAFHGHLRALAKSVKEGHLLDSATKQTLKQSHSRTTRKLRAGAWPYAFDSRLQASFLPFFFCTFTALSMWLLFSAAVGRTIKGLPKPEREQYDFGWIILDMAAPWSTFVLVFAIGLVAACSSFGRVALLQTKLPPAARWALCAVIGVALSLIGWIPSNIPRAEHPQVKVGSLVFFLLLYASLLFLPRATRIQKWSLGNALLFPFFDASVFGILAWIVVGVTDKVWLTRAVGLQVFMRALLVWSIVAVLVVFVRLRVAWGRAAAAPVNPNAAPPPNAGRP